LYRPGASIGDGGTASYLQYIAKNGVPAGMTNHFQKAQQMITTLNNIISKNALSVSDLKLAYKLIGDLVAGLAANGIR